MRVQVQRAVRDDDGFSLMELLVAMAIGSVVLTALMMVFLNGMSGTAKVTDRASSTARARLTSDAMSTLMQAAVCNNNAAPIVTATASTMAFTANRCGPDDLPFKYQLRWDSATKNVYKDVYTGTLQSDGSTVAYPSAPTSTVLIGTNMAPADGTNLFSYYAFSSSTGTVSSTALAAPVTNANSLKSIIAVTSSLLALPERTTGSSDPATTSVQAQSVIGSVDPSNPGQGTQC